MNPGPLTSCAELQTGDRIEAWTARALQHTGTVDQTLPRMGLVWIYEDPLNERKLLDAAELQIRRIPADTAPG